MKYELIIFDIGKTLYDKNFSVRASDCVLHDLDALRKKGLKVGVCTMRTIQHCKKVVPVELDFYISLNGSYIICEGEVIVDKPTIIPSGHIDFLSYGKDFTCYSTEKAKILADVNGFLADSKGVASPAYNVVLFLHIQQNSIFLSITDKRTVTGTIVHSQITIFQCQSQIDRVFGRTFR